MPLQESRGARASRVLGWTSAMGEVTKKGDWVMGDCRCDKPEMAETTLEYGALAITLMHHLFVIKHVFTPSMGVA